MEKYAGGKRLVHPDRFLIFSHRVELPYFHGKEFAHFPPWNKPCDPTIWSELRPDTPHWVSQNIALAVIWLIRTPELEKNSGNQTQSACVKVFFSCFWFLTTYLVFLMLIIAGLLFLSDSLLLCPICLDSTYFSDSFFNFYLSNLPQVSAQSSFPIKTQYKQSILNFKRLHCLNICLLLNPPSLSMCAIG